MPHRAGKAEARRRSQLVGKCLPSEMLARGTRLEAV